MNKKVINADIVASHIRFMCKYHLMCDLQEIGEDLDPYVADALNNTSLRLIERFLSK